MPCHCNCRETLGNVRLEGPRRKKKPIPLYRGRHSHPPQSMPIWCKGKIYPRAQNLARDRNGRSYVTTVVLLSYLQKWLSSQKKSFPSHNRGADETGEVYLKHQHRWRSLQDASNLKYVWREGWSSRIALTFPRTQVIGPNWILQPSCQRSKQFCMNFSPSLFQPWSTYVPRILPPSLSTSFLRSEGYKHKAVKAFMPSEFAEAQTAFWYTHNPLKGGSGDISSLAASNIQ